jgi:hypothetical protein
MTTQNLTEDRNLYRTFDGKNYKLYFRGRLVRKSGRPYAAACVTADRDACVSFHHDRGLALKADNGLVIEAVDVTESPEAVAALESSEREMKRRVAAQKRFVKKVDKVDGLVISSHGDNLSVYVREDDDARNPGHYVGGRKSNLATPRLGDYTDGAETQLRVAAGPYVEQAAFEAELTAAVEQLTALLEKARREAADWTMPQPFVNARRYDNSIIIEVTVGSRKEMHFFRRNGSDDFARRDLRETFQALGTHDVLCSSDVDDVKADHGFDARAELGLALDW